MRISAILMHTWSGSSISCRYNVISILEHNKKKLRLIAWKKPRLIAWKKPYCKNVLWVVTPPQKSEVGTHVLF